MKRMTWMLLALALQLGGIENVRAGTIIYDFSGSISSAAGAYAGLNGESFTGSFSLDDSTPANQISSNYAQYLGAVKSFQIDINSTIFTLGGVTSKYANLGPADVNIMNNDVISSTVNEDYFNLNMGSYNYSTGFYNEALQLNLGDQAVNPTALSSTSLAGLQLNLADFQFQHEVTFWDDHGPSTSSFTTDQWAGNITSLELQGSSVSAVPEPSSLALFGIGTSVMGLAAACRRRRVESQA